MILEPPPQYVYPPTVPLYVEERRLSDVGELCRALGVVADQDQIVYGCALPGPSSCYIIIPLQGIGGVGPRTYAAIRRHEIAHCNGWKH